MTDLQTILASVLTSSAISAGVVFVLREWISVRLKASIEHEYKVKEHQLNAELQERLDGFRAGYQKVIDENQIRFTRLHTDQAESIKGLYTRSRLTPRHDRPL